MKMGFFKCMARDMRHPYIPSTDRYTPVRFYTSLLVISLYYLLNSPLSARKSEYDKLVHQLTLLCKGSLEMKYQATVFLMVLVYSVHCFAFHDTFFVNKKVDVKRQASTVYECVGAKIESSPLEVVLVRPQRRL